VLRAAPETETTQDSIQDWLQLDEGDPGFQLLTEEEIVAVIFFYSYSSSLPVLINFKFTCIIQFSKQKAIFPYTTSINLFNGENVCFL
jgi:hypothetical protein